MRDTGIAFLAYTFGILFDIAAIRRVPFVKPWLAFIMVILHLTALYRLMRYSSRMPVPRVVQVPSAILAPFLFIGMLYSLFFEIPLRKAWVREGHTDELVTDGFYALTRHPGVIWYTLFVTAASLGTRSKRLLLASPPIILGDVGHVAFQEQFVLGNVFGEAYEEYQRTTPMLVPNRASLRRFLGQFRRRG